MSMVTFDPILHCVIADAAPWAAHAAASAQSSLPSMTDTMTTDQMGGITKIPRGWIERIEYLHAAGAFDDRDADSSVSKDSIDGRDARSAG